MRKFCKYCAQSTTKLDMYGYCVKYDCITKSGISTKIAEYDKLSWSIRFDDKLNGYGNVGKIITNPYSLRERAAQNLLADAKLNCVEAVSTVTNILYEYINKPWDRNIRW